MDQLDICGKQYGIIKLLGKGKGGYSYLVTDGEGEYVLKQIHHEPCDYYQFGDKLQSELRDYATLSSLGITMPRLLAVDEKQERLLKEYIPGDTVYHLVLKDQLPAECFDLIRQMCGILYSAGINIDYFPTNFVVCRGKLYYVDYECNDYMHQWDFENWGRQYWWLSEAFKQHFGLTQWK